MRLSANVIGASGGSVSTVGVMNAETGSLSLAL
jgi:hypothetical protein